MRSIFFLRSIFIIYTSLFLFSCNETKDLEVHSLSFREKFLVGKSEEQIRNDFNLASFEDKKKLWVEKLESLEKQNFNINIKNNISVLKNFVTHYGSLEAEQYKAFGKASKELAEQVPAEDFVKMFNTLEDYKFSGKFVGRDFLSSAFNMYIDEEVGLNTPTNGMRLSAYGKDCDCRWCFFVDKLDVSSNCDETRNGCGFLWLQSCDKVVSIFGGDKVIKTEEEEKKEKEEGKP